VGAPYHMLRRPEILTQIGTAKTRLT